MVTGFYAAHHETGHDYTCGGGLSSQLVTCSAANVLYFAATS